VKTVHLTNAWHPSSGGVGTFYRALMDSANTLGREVSLIVPGPSDSVEQFGANCRIYSVKAPTSPFDRNYRFITPSRFLGPRSRVASILRHEQPDLVEVCDKYTLHYVGGLLRIGWFAGCRPTVVGLSCERFDENISAYCGPGAAVHGLCRGYMKWLYFPLADHHIAVTEHTAGELRTASRGHKVRRGVWIAPMGVDAVTFTPQRRSADYRAALRQRLGVSESAVLALYVGRLAPEKNLMLLAETASALRAERHAEFHLLVAGDGPMRGRLEAAARSGCPGRVHFLGHIGDRGALADLYANCDVFLHPNPREPFGIAPLEAMACGIPLVGPRTGGVRTYATDENAWLAENDPAAYARACIDAVFSAKAPERTRAGTTTARRYAWPEVCRRYFSLYEDLHRCRVSGRDTSTPAAFHSTRGGLLGFESQ
jgi:alpha-1,6-mannosyltransferase